MTELLQQAFVELSKLPNEQQDAIATSLLANLRKNTQNSENVDPNDTPIEEILEGLCQGLHEALTGQLIPLSKMWDGIDAES